MFVKLRNILGLTCLALATVFFAAAGAQAQSITLTFADSFPLTHDLSKEGMVYWMKRAEKLSNGAVTFTHYPAEQLIKARALFGAISSGTVDAGYIANAYFTDKLPLNGVADIPGAISSSVNGSKSYWKLLNEDGPLKSEFLGNNVVPLAFIVMPPYQLVLRGKAIADIKDLRGLKIRSGGGIQNLTIAAVGATPVSMTAPDIYLGIQRGTLDGTLLSAISLKPYKLGEVVKSITQNVPFGSPAIGLGMNAAKFRSLPKNVQSALVQAGHDMVEHLSGYLDGGIAEAESELKKGGIAVYEPSAKVQQEIAARLKTVAADWAKRVGERGLPADKILADFMDRVKNQR